MISQISIRWKMTLAVMIPLVIILFLVSLAASYLINARLVGDAQKQVRHDLSAAREVLHHEVDRIADVARFTAHAPDLVAALERGDLDRVQNRLETIRQREGLDFLCLTEAGTGEDLPPFVARTLDEGRFSGVALLDAGTLQAQASGLAERARVPIEGGEGVSGVEDRGMVLVGSYAVRDARGHALGCLYGGVLLNNNLSLIDRIKEVVYGDQSYQGVDAGSATLFLETLRVATTVRMGGGQRAQGTRVSAAVAEAVLGRKEIWLDRARVVDDWYLTAYEPIIDHEGRAIGALYVGLLERPFSDLKANASLVLMGLLLLGSTLGFLIARLLSLRLSRPVLDLEAMAERVAAGERDLQMAVASQDEVGHLTVAFNRMTAALKERDDELQTLNRGLEQKVAERTVQLEEKSLALIRAQEELLRSEKLAAIGSLAAGVAHEINNPAAIIRGNVEILLMELATGRSGREEAEEIMKQTERIALITSNMLAFAREEKIHAGQVQVNSLLQSVLDQAGHQVPLAGVEVVRSLADDLPTISGDSQRLRQVFTNLAVNALQALKGEGRLEVSSRLCGDQVEIVFRDTGPGVPLEVRASIFHPFFTTRTTGTGLGLSISYGIVQAHGGTITVSDAEGGGALFCVRLPIVSPGENNLPHSLT